MKNKIIILGVVALLVLGIFVVHINESSQLESVTQAPAVPTPTPDSEYIFTLQREEIVKLFNFAKGILEEKDFLPTSIMVKDINDDGLPEIAFNYGGGWEYRVCYYSNGEVREIGGLESWKWVSSLFSNDEGDIVFYTSAPSTEAGNEQIRIYKWNGFEYKLSWNLCTKPKTWDGKEVTELYYFASDAIIDFKSLVYKASLNNYPQVTKQEYEAKLPDFEEMTIFSGYRYERLYSTQEHVLSSLQLRLEPWDC